MRRLTVLVALVALLAGCGGGEKTVARVGSDKIPERDLEALLEFSKEHALEEGEDFPEEGTAEFRRLRTNFLKTLINLSEFRQKADELGIEVKDEEIEQREQTIESDQPRDKQESEGNVIMHARELLAEHGLLREKLYAHAIREVTVGAAEARAFYDSHRSQFRDVAAARAALLAQKQSAAGQRFFDQIEAEFAPTVKIEED
jgi:hypothetical protein